MWDPEVEQRPWADQKSTDEPVYRRQMDYLFANSRFYREKLTAAGFEDAAAVGGLGQIAELPLTEKDELRATPGPKDPIGTHLAAPVERIARVFSTSGTTGTPSYVPLTAADLDNWVETSCRSYCASGVKRGDRIVSTYNAGPFVAGATLDAFNRMGLCHIPVGTGNTERLMAAVRLLEPETLAMTPSYALHLAEWGKERGFDTRASSVKRILCGGEPGGGEPATRGRIEDAWGAQVTEAMGIGDISISLWGECEARQGMHFSGRGLVHFELIDPVSAHPIPIVDGASGELVLTHLRHEAAPLLRFRTRDHVIVWTGPCPCGRTAPRLRCIGRTDDMLIVRGVNVFPSALRDVINAFAPTVSGAILVKPAAKGFRQDPPLPVTVELGEGIALPPDLSDRIRKRIRDVLLVTTDVTFTPYGSLPRSDYKAKLVHWPG